MHKRGAQKSWIASFLYVDYDAEKRGPLWADIKNIVASFSDPWIVVGDLNMVGIESDKDVSKKCEELEEVLTDCELMEVAFKGQSYTWSNGRHGVANVRERIDKANIYCEFNILFPSIVVIHEAVRGSDHCPLIIPFVKEDPLFHKPIKFESYWTLVEGCKETIASHWAYNGNGSPMFKLVSNIKLCRAGLSAWKKGALSNNAGKLAYLEEDLLSVQRAEASKENLECPKALIQEMDVVRKCFGTRDQELSGFIVGTRILGFSILRPFKSVKIIKYRG